ncbi:hypothetical protein TrispH2_000879 [Trichoplax sp. H2]|nr:hypothetical protein TrispH2_000879 [Trichoplax sp. H2]|eukprot:RDD47641.1 hypothetical protein TrispH2_000879 [Trichoplax sp. H2]
MDVSANPISHFSITRATTLLRTSWKNRQDNPQIKLIAAIFNYIKLCKVHYIDVSARKFLRIPAKPKMLRVEHGVKFEMQRYYTIKRKNPVFARHAGTIVRIRAYAL